MSFVNKLFTTGQKVLLASGHRDNFQVMQGADAGKTFCATLDIAEVIEFDSDTGADRRMQSVIRILPPTLCFEENDVVQNVQDGKKYKLIKRDNNASMITVDFWVEQLL